MCHSQNDAIKNKTHKRGKHLMNNYRSKLFIGEPTELMS